MGKHNKKSKSAINLYVRLTEDNDWEGERWNFYIPIDGNEKAIEHLKSCVFGDPHTGLSISTRMFDEKEVDLLVELDDANDSYMPTHTKCSGILSPTKMKKLSVENMYDHLYKGGIEKFFMRERKKK